MERWLLGGFLLQKFVKAIIKLPFTGEFLTDGWLPNIFVNLHGSHEQLKKLLKFALQIERGDNACHQFLSSHRMSGY